MLPMSSINSSETSRPYLLPKVADYLKVFNEQVIPAVMKSGSVPNAINAREGLANLTQAFVTEPVDIPLIIDDIIFSSNDGSLGSYAVPVRIFHPSAVLSKPLPTMLYFHGGGGTAGSVTVYDGILRRLAKRTGHIVVAPEYRLAPENPYPCAQNDAYTALTGLADLLERLNIATTQEVVVAGDSHGGALVSNLLRDPRVLSPNAIDNMTDQSLINSIVAQVLIYPSVDFTMSCPSIDTYATGYLLSRSRIDWYFDQYFQRGEDKQSKSALFASQDELSAQPPALIFNARVDPLVDEGKAYVQKLTEAGVDVKHIIHDGVIHAYLNMEDLNPDICDKTYHAISKFLGEYTAHSR